MSDYDHCLRVLRSQALLLHKLSPPTFHTTLGWVCGITIDLIDMAPNGSELAKAFLTVFNESADARSKLILERNFGENDEERDMLYLLYFIKDVADIATPCSFMEGLEYIKRLRSTTAKELINIIRTNKDAISRITDARKGVS